MSFPTQEECGLGTLDYKAVKENLADINKKRSTYNKFKDDDRYAIGKYAAIYGTNAALIKFKMSHPYYRLTESTVRSMREKYQKVSKVSPTSRTITSLKRGRPLMLGSLDEKVRTFLLLLRSKGGVVNSVVAIAVAQALIAKSSDESLKLLDLNNSSWSKSLFVRMGFVQRASTTARPEITEGARQESELVFHHEIVKMVEKYSIPYSLIINIDQTPLKYAPVPSRTMARRNSKHVHVAGFSFKQAITGTFFWASFYRCN